MSIMEYLEPNPPTESDGLANVASSGEDGNALCNTPPSPLEDSRVSIGQSDGGEMLHKIDIERQGDSEETPLQRRVRLEHEQEYAKLQRAYAAMGRLVDEGINPEEGYLDRVAKEAGVWRTTAQDAI